MNSEVWVCLTDAQRCLPFVLVDRGFDVWVGTPLQHPPCGRVDPAIC